MISKEYLFKAVVLSMLMPVSVASARAVTSNTDLGWRKNDGVAHTVTEYVFSSNLSFTDFSPLGDAFKQYGVLVDTGSPANGTTKSGYKQTLTSTDSLTIRPTITSGNGEAAAANIQRSNTGASGCEHKVEITFKGDIVNLELNKTIGGSGAVQGIYTQGLDWYNAGAGSVQVAKDGQSVVTTFDNTETNIKLTVDPTDTANTYGQVIGAYIRNNATVNFNSDTTNLNITTGNKVQQNLQGMEVDAHSLANFTGKNINIDLTNNTTETTGNRGIVGIGSQGDATVTGATGVYFTGADANVKINLTGNNNAQSIYSVMLTQNAILDVSSNVDKFILHTNYAGTNANAKVMGVELNTGGTNTVANFHNKTTEINITNLNNTNDDNLSAVHINSIGGKVVFDGDNATLTTTGGSNSGTTIYVAGAKAEPSQVFVNAKDTIIKATATTSTDVNNSTAACAWKENAGIYINSDENGAAQGNTVNIEGGMWSLTGGTIKANLTNANSSLTGWTSVVVNPNCNTE